MTVTARPLINSKYASNAGTQEYLCANALISAIIDKFTAFNNNGSAVTLSIHIIPSGGSSGNSNLLVNKSVTAGASLDVTELQNQILGPGDSIFVSASVGSQLTIRASGREVK